jgi:hypothetical protein
VKGVARAQRHNGAATSGTVWTRLLRRSIVEYATVG